MGKSKICHLNLSIVPSHYLFRTVVGAGTSLPFDPPLGVWEVLEGEGWGVITLVGVGTCSRVFVFLFIIVNKSFKLV